jgi:hypothetical protein
MSHGLREVEVSGTDGGAVKCVDIIRNTGADNVTYQLDEDNEPQPDLSLFIDPARGGQVSISVDGYLVGGPELIAEIAVSSVATRRGPKRRVYERHGVREYIIWRVEEHIIEWYALRDGTFELLPVGNDGIVRSKIFPGLWMNMEATLRRDGPEAMEALRQGLATLEHAKFVEKLGSYPDKNSPPGE